MTEPVHENPSKTPKLDLDLEERVRDWVKISDTKTFDHVDTKGKVDMGTSH